MSEAAVVVGIDVSQACLDVALAPGDERWSVANEAAGITELVQRLRERRPGLVVLEATGGYEVALTACLRKLLTMLSAMVRSRTYRRQPAIDTVAG